MEEISIITLIGMICTVLSVAMIYFKTINSLDRRLTKMETKTNLLWKVVEREIPRLLKNPHSITKDRLLDKMSNKNLTLKEAVKLKGMLENEIRKKEGTIVIAYSLTIARLEQYIGGLVE